MLIFHVFATDLLTEEEAEHLWMPTAIKPNNVSRAYFERAYAAGGFSATDTDIVGNEWREHGEENESRRTSLQLLRIARLRRHRERFIAQFGEKDYAVELANCHYGVYQMLGKLQPVILSLVNAGGQHETTPD